MLHEYGIAPSAFVYRGVQLRTNVSIFSHLIAIIVSCYLHNSTAGGGVQQRRLISPVVTPRYTILPRETMHAIFGGEGTVEMVHGPVQPSPLH